MTGAVWHRLQVLHTAVANDSITNDTTDQTCVVREAGGYGYHFA